MGVSALSSQVTSFQPQAPSTLPHSGPLYSATPNTLRPATVTAAPIVAQHGLSSTGVADGGDATGANVASDPYGDAAFDPYLVDGDAAATATALRETLEDSDSDVDQNPDAFRGFVAAMMEK